MFFYFIKNCPNIFSARKFVSWYNGHPDHVENKFDLNTEVATVIGHGNVALDVARILLKSPDELKVIIIFFFFSNFINVFV